MKTPRTRDRFHPLPAPRAPLPLRNVSPGPPGRGGARPRHKRQARRPQRTRGRGQPALILPLSQNGRMRTPYPRLSSDRRSAPGALVVLIVALLLVAAACSGDDRDDQRSGASGTSAPGTGGPGTTTGGGSNGSGGSALPATGDLAKARVRLQQIAKLESAVGMAVRKGDSGVYFIEQTGRVRAFSSSTMNPDPILDISGQIKAGGEQGLLGIA